MKKIVLQDTSVSSFNMGDYIIMDYFKKHFNYLLKNNFVINYASHTSNFSLKDKLKLILKGDFKEFDYNFMCGTNALNSNLNIYKGFAWKISLSTPRKMRGVTCVAIGSSDNLKKSLYSKLLYKRNLSKKNIHSTRDERTAEYLRSLGFSAINTSCITLWSITNEICEAIPTTKSENVIFTLTDYNQNRGYDIKLIDILLENYKKVSFWIQGSGDYNYFKSLGNYEKVNIISPNVDSYDEYLKNTDTDYVGTRLHAGIRAVNFKKRAIILSVDNRANDMIDTSGLCIIDRKNTKEILEKINGDFRITPHINQENVKIFMEQFKNDK